MAGACVLIVDDDEDLCELARRRFAKEGYELRAAPSGAEGLRLLRELEPSAIILDVGLPDVDGVILYQQVR